MTSDLLDTINDVNKSLTILRLQVQADSRAGLGSRNRVAENMLLPALRRVYGAPGLASCNTRSANFPGVDLFDPTSGLGVQVTSERTSAKISETITTLVGGSLSLKHLVVCLIADAPPDFNARTRAKWVAAAKGHFAFDPSDDVLAFDQLLSRVQSLPAEEIVSLADELGMMVRGTHRVHLIPHLRRQVETALESERQIGRYIPDVFVETQDTKYEARCFAHPALFVRHIATWFDRQPLARLNQLAAQSGLPPLCGPSTGTMAAEPTLEGAISAAKSLIREVGRLGDQLSTYREVDTSEGAVMSRDMSRAHVFEETRHDIGQRARGLQYSLSERATELHCVAARLFLLTGPAGQGKTNFLCDFAERFLLRHDVPCAYVTARQLSRIPHPDLTEVLRRLIFPAAVTTIDEGLDALAAACAERRQPFVLVIDGLNEHPDVRAFAGQLEHLLESLLRHPHVRVIMTCRSEFLEQRFGALLSGPLAAFLHVSRAHGQRMDDGQHRELVERYFKHFEVQQRFVASHVIETLRQDILLLRFFCEAYGARGRDSRYEAPYLAGIYRDEIFRRYVEDKLGRAREAIARDTSERRPLARRPGFRSVLSIVAGHMLAAGRFTDVPRSVVPATLDAELTALLDEELVLRRDLGVPTLLLSEPIEVLNFTFDELRDFLLAEHLLTVHAQNPDEFTRLLAAQQQTAAQSIEGVQRFLFYASRVPHNRHFFEGYRVHPWYAEVYDNEVFAVRPTQLDNEDRLSVEAALAAGGERAQHFARMLALCWQRSVFPVLNLEVLLAVSRRVGPSVYSDVIVPAFANASYGRRPLGEEFCRFVKDRVLPTFVPDRDDECAPLFRLLLLLLPVGASPTLDSPASAVFRELIAAHRTYAIGLLREALDDGGGQHRPFLWRLLSAARLAVDESAYFRAAAAADVADDKSDAPLRREAGWFLKRESATRRPA